MINLLPTSKSIKKEAKKRLSGKWPLAIAATMIFLFFIFFLLMLFSLMSQFFSQGFSEIIISTFLIVVGTVLGFPLCFGLLRLFRYIYEDIDTSLYTIFYYFSSKNRFAKTLKLSAILLSKIAITALILFLPAIIADLLASGKLPFFAESGMPIWFSNLWVFGSFLRSLAKVILLIVIIYHCPAISIFTLNDDLDCFEILHLSKKVARKSFISLLSLLVSFLGFFLISLFVVPLIFTIPLFVMSFLIHSDAAVELYNKNSVSNIFFEIDNKFNL